MKVLSYHKKSWILYEEQEGYCFYCDFPFRYDQMTRDHFFPRSKGGKSRGNMVLACGKCNSEKSSQTIYEFRIYTCRKAAQYLRLPRVQMAHRLQSGQLKLIERWRNIIAKCTYLLKADIETLSRGNSYTALHPDYIKNQVK